MIAGVYVLFMFILIATFFVVTSVTAIHSGRVRVRGEAGDTFRAKNPIQFWLVLDPSWSSLLCFSVRPAT
jgi:hypothetical protein